MDPAKFGRGPKGEIWEFNKAVSDLLTLCGELLTNKPILFIITAYNLDYSSKELSLLLKMLMKDFSGKLEYGNLVQQEKSAGRKIHQAIYARWSSI